MTPAGLAELSDREVILALQELTEDLMAGAAPDTTPLDQDEAALLLATLLRRHGEEVPATLVPGDAAGYSAARRLLVTLADEPAYADSVAAVLAEPPTDSRLSADMAVSGVVVLGAVIAWLQTKVEIRFKRAGGKTEFEFRVRKEAADGTTLRDLASVVSRMLGGPRP
ncbi:MULTISPECIES: hypothetical protein [Kitasatospora]|uniref:hypothetical protein n=1 Tax=Kitasatospora TaxID=2063 RepID=UPI000C70900A|nr:hypothetical protein [Kitasatospora sp. GP30]MDH6145034.1 hypothetical protein [Kitasatospora sp. GP30]